MRVSVHMFLDKKTATWTEERTAPHREGAEREGEGASVEGLGIL